MLTEQSGEFETALTQDLGKAPTESVLTEIGFLHAELDHARKHLRRWMRPRSVHVPPALQPASAKIQAEPLGAVLIIAPWNYPLMLALSPLIGAIAAGNVAVVKPSEHAPATSRTLARLLPRYLDRRAVTVVEGGVPETTELLAQRWDHIFYTGNAQVAKIVAAAAATHLTPVTLELGGKSPLYIDESVPIAAAAQRIVWSAFVNAGQTCVAPDYLLATRAVQQRLLPHLVAAIEELYGTNPKENPDYPAIVNERQFDRLLALCASGSIHYGGQHDRDARFLAPTLLTDVPRDSPIMAEEIFGPILPLITVDDLDDAISFVRAGEKPLALYVMSQHRDVQRRWINETSSGAIGVGLALAQLSIHDLPFGGVGMSGMGSYHGKYSFTTMSHMKPVVTKPYLPDTLRSTIMPPYTAAKETFIRTVLRKLS